MSAVQLIAGMSWKAVVAAEVLSIPRHSLGYEMMNSKYYLQTPVLFAYILVIVVLSLAMEKIIGLLMEGQFLRDMKGAGSTSEEDGKGRLDTDVYGRCP